MLSLVVFAALVGQAPDYYLEVERPDVLVPQPPKVVRQPPAQIPVYRLPAVTEPVIPVPVYGGAVVSVVPALPTLPALTVTPAPMLSTWGNVRERISIGGPYGTYRYNYRYRAR